MANLFNDRLWFNISRGISTDAYNYLAWCSEATTLQNVQQIITSDDQFST